MWQYCCFTINNWTQEDIDTLKGSEYLRYYVYGEEIAPTTGTPHLQGYLQTSKRVTQKYLKSILPRAKLIKSIAKNQVRAANYCKKGDQTHEEWEESHEAHPRYGLNAKVTEWGQMGPGQGARTDMDKLKTRVDKGEPVNLIIKDCDNYQQARFVELLVKYREPSMEYVEKEVYWFWGPTGLGKTRAAYDMAKEREMTFWISGKTSQWFQGYWGQEFALIDELRAKNWPYEDLLMLTDGYERRFQQKGTDTIWKPKVVIITAPSPPEEVYRGQIDHWDHIDQLMRRLKYGANVREFKAEEVPADVVEDLEQTPHKRQRDDSEDNNDNVKKQKK